MRPRSKGQNPSAGVSPRVSPPWGYPANNKTRCRTTVYTSSKVLSYPRTSLHCWWQHSTYCRCLGRHCFAGFARHSAASRLASPCSVSSSRSCPRRVLGEGTSRSTIAPQPHETCSPRKRRVNTSPLSGVGWPSPADGFMLRQLLKEDGHHPQGGTPSLYH